ncbi:uncharacterized protein LOC128998584 [Macrosteles quadrilineatus]|uniref:uncharacterized protein LOC128998584 n=1 Tax=Macrosteles quadrilineatus TaxID=74068 RepID=UPI0023E300D7|nr:uncharacterized protein LOC128998584 [Macrosteles quadrilineatus]
MSRVSLVIVLILWHKSTDAEPDTVADSGADFLQSVISRMQNEKYINYAEDLQLEDYRPTPHPYNDIQHHDLQHHDIQHHDIQHHDVQHHETSAPPLSKGELLALYQASVAASTGLNISAEPPLPLSNEVNNHHQDELVAPAEQGVLNGYYYYFYPIKSFLNQTDDDHTMANSSQDMMMMMMSDAGMMDGNKDMMVDPLFLATAGFVTMATLISVGILFLPKFGSDRSWKKAALKNIPEEEDDMFSLTRVIGQAIQGKDCAERLACELGRTIRNMKLGQKPLRVLEAMLPRPLAQQLSQVRQHVVKREKCQFIPCKWNKQKPNNKQERKPQRQPKTNVHSI